MSGVLNNELGLQGPQVNEVVAAMQNGGLKPNAVNPGDVVCILPDGASLKNQEVAVPGIEP